MTLIQLLGWNTDRSSGRLSFRPSWKTAALFGIPVCIFGFAGLSYYLYKHYYFNHSTVIEVVPKTPLEAAVSLKNRGNKYFKGRQYEKAIQLYDEGLEQCPSDAVAERAALYQNRAAAKENLRQYESAVADCTLALELSPRYLKALNRRAHLYEKLEAWDDCLADVIACCMFEEFKNTDNVICMDQILKKVGQLKVQNEWKQLPHSLPSAAFIRNYLSAFSWNPFEISAVVNGTSVSDISDISPIDMEDQRETHSPDDQSTIPASLHTANEALNRALTLLASGDYDESMASVLISEESFEAFLSTSEPVLPKRMVGEGDEATSTNVDDAAVSTIVNGPGHTESIAVNREKSLTPDQLARTKAAYCKASLLYATYLALAGRAVESKQRLQAVAAEGSGADPVVRVSALIKSACLSMSVDQNFAACLHEFQTAENVCPDCPDVYLHRGQINLLADQLDEALYDLNTAVKLKPEFSIAQAQRLYALYRKALSESNSERASDRVEEFRRLAQKYPHCLETHSLFAQVLMERGEFSASDEEFARLIELAPKSGLAHAHRGLLQLRWKQDRDAAFKWFSLGAKVDPKCELIHELLGQLAVERGEFTTALEHFELAIREAKTQNDLAHLIALREGVRAQWAACEKYGISIADVANSLRREQQMMMGLC